MADAVNEITMPKLGESVTEGTLATWLKSVGDEVAFDDPLFEVSTDKVDSEIPSPYDGVLLQILVQPGETVPVGTPLARIGPAGAEVAGEHSPVDESVAPPPPLNAAPAGAGGAATSAGPTATTGGAAAGGNGAKGPLSPVVRRLAADNDVDLSRITGSGVGGRIMREDVVAALATGTVTTAPVAAPAALAGAGTAPAAPAGSTATRAPVAAPVAGVGEEVVALSRIRLVTAERMVESKRISPHVWTSIEVDLERIEQVRQQYKAAFRKSEGASLTYLPFMARAICDALRAFPTVNSSIDLASKTMTLHRYVNLAIAVDLNEQGLMAPVIKGADALNLRGMARAIKAVGDGAKNKALKSEDLSGSTFTISNPGPLGTYASAAIINQPNVGIITTEGVARRPTVVGDGIAIHHMCVLGLSYDHRAFDGVTAARFLAYIRDALQNRDWEAELA
jgi:2-oxoglutarate dehydrogenase E2 component (dihydrolipoamide succinyltransferase)